MSLIRISFLNYLNRLNEDEIQELMGYLTQLADDYKQDYSKFKGNYSIIKYKLSN